MTPINHISFYIPRPRVYDRFGLMPTLANVTNGIIEGLL
jgi:hypothetical protein